MNRLSPTLFLIKKTSLALASVGSSLNDPVITNEPVRFSDPVMDGENIFINYKYL